jgi:beta-xylosidase
MSPDGTRLLDGGTLVFDGHARHSTVEGPKFYKRNGYYYIFAPAGGVSTGWQLILRSKNVFGPYEEKVVLEQGSTEINGPHQGGWVELASGESWFVHFQDREAYGRIVHLQPVNWVEDWPLMGEDLDGNGIGEPVASFRKPKVSSDSEIVTPFESDEFELPELDLQWQWHGNPKLNWAFPTANGYLRMNALSLPDSAKNLWDVPQLLLQKFPAPSFAATVKFNFNPKKPGDRFGLLVMGEDYGHLAILNLGDRQELVVSGCRDASRGNAEQELARVEVPNSGSLWFRVSVEPEANYRFSYSSDGNSFKPIGESLIAKPGRWIGSKVGLFSNRQGVTNDSGYTDVDWFRVEPVQNLPL